MLVITRKTGQTIRIGDDIVVSIERIDGGDVRVGVSAPKDVAIVRE